MTCEAPQHLSEACPYLVLRRRDGEGENAPLVPRLTSASQIEAYSTCPLCWFVSYRVKPQSIDAGFGNMEKGNFVHDVLEHLHARLPQEGMERVTPENLPRAQELLREVLTRPDRARRQARHGGPLVPLSAVEERQVAEILPQLEGVLAYESEALAPLPRATWSSPSTSSRSSMPVGRSVGASTAWTWTPRPRRGDRLQASHGR
ncbi:MAG: PD-(D/E)XK nuclease family protein [Collinsella sp.]